MLTTATECVWKQILPGRAFRWGPSSGRHFAALWQIRRQGTQISHTQIPDPQTLWDNKCLWFKAPTFRHNLSHSSRQLMQITINSIEKRKGKQIKPLQGRQLPGPTKLQGKGCGDSWDEQVLRVLRSLKDTHSFIQKLCIQCFLHARHWARLRG